MNLSNTLNPVPKPERKPKSPSRPIRRSGKPRAVNPKRKKRLFNEDFGGQDYLDYIHSLPCAICEAPCEYTEAAHVRSRGAGGKAEDLVPLCGNRQRGTFPKRLGLFVPGCHFKFDTHNVEVYGQKFRLTQLAKKLRADFLDSLSAGAKRV